MGKRNTAGRFTEDGLPRNANEWTEADWRTLWEHLKAITNTIGGRHAKHWASGKGGGGVDPELRDDAIPGGPPDAGLLD